MDVTAIIMAAGEGTRMKSNHAKVSHALLGKPMICWVVDAALAAGCNRIVVVIGSHADEVRSLLDARYGASEAARVECVEQTERLGTAHAVRCALDATGIDAGPMVILNGDLPLIKSETIRTFADTVADGTHAPEQAAGLLECNAGCYAFDGAQLAAHIGEVGCDNAQGEYYLPDMVEILKAAGQSVTIYHCDDYREGLGVNSRAQLAQLTALARDAINERLMAEGVTFIDPAQAWIGPDAQIGRDTVVWPQTHLIGACVVGEDCQLGPNTRLTDTRVGDRCAVDETVAVDAVLENDVDCGPRAYLRPGTHMLDGSKAGTHVEIKKSTIGRGSKVPHLSYIGDTTMGEGVNIGAGSITCNYDGKNKNATVIGDRTFIGSDTMMVAPVHIGSDAITGAGGTITKDVPDGALALERTEQRIVEGYTERRRARL